MNSEEIKSQRLKYCRFYKGEEGCPFVYWTNDTQDAIKADYWWLEKYYVRGLGDKLRSYDIYRNEGGKEFDTIPAELLDVFINSWSKYGYYFPARENPKEMEDFYKWVEEYLSFRDKVTPDV